jgi:dTDP-4-dehydrorhamnose 3,5-epimerase
LQQLVCERKFAVPAPVEFTQTELPGVYVVAAKVFADARGYFTETWSAPAWRAKGFDFKFVQDNLSRSERGVLRGMHYQIRPAAMGKLVRCLHGAIYDVAVDLRRGAPTFGKWIARELTAANGLALWVPEGFAHGFLALEDDSLVHYKCTAVHTPECERALAYNCPEVNIQWPFAPATISPKDLEAPCLGNAEYNFD